MLRTASEHGRGESCQLPRLGVPKQLAGQLLRNQAPIEYARGSIIFLEKSPADLFFHIEAGAVKLCFNASEGSRFVVRLAGPGEVIGDSCTTTIDSLPTRPFQAEAFTRVSVIPITRERIRRVSSNLSASEMLDAIEQASAAWAEDYVSMVRFVNLSFRRRLETVLKDLSRRFGIPDARGTMIPLELSHDDWSELIGSSRPMASRLLSEMIDERIISRQGRRYIVVKL